MRLTTIFTAAAALLVFPQYGRGQDQGQMQTTPPTAASSSAPAAQNPPAKPDPIVEAARRSREQKKETTKPAKVFDNDNIPGRGGVSFVGETAAAPTGESAAQAEAAGKAAPNGEKTWRDRFAKLRHKLEQDQSELDLMQREWGQLEVQFYTDPVKGMQQGLTRSDINEKTAKIDAKKKQIEADNQAISDAEDELRISGGDAGWAR
jgi:hypothetical protein